VTAILDRAAFIRAHTRLLPTPHAPEISLHIADEATELWQRTEDELGAIGLPPPFWAFAWAGGQALARYILDHPHVVAGKRVLDFASGSGLVAIAAAKAGAAHVEACDIDGFAVEAMQLNAEANGVTIHPRLDNLVGLDGGWDVALAGDVSYERDMALAVTDWLESLARRGALALIGDPGRTYLARERLDCVVEYSVPVTRSLEDCEIKKSQVWRFKPAFLSDPASP
jgi:predicted nicotinamide N-methyase